MSSTGSISVTGLLGGTAGQIDVTSLISSLMSAAAIPQTQLQDQLSTQQSLASAYQAVNTKLTALQTAAEALTDPTAWTATAATSSASSVVATSDGTATVGSTTFSVTQLAKAQVSTVSLGSDGTALTDTAAGFTLSLGGKSYTFGTGTGADYTISSGSGSDIATAINKANLGVHASVVTTDQGTILQLNSTKTGTANAFTVSGLDNTATTVTGAKDAQLTVGDPNGTGSYTVSSSSNTFTSFIPGVTFTVSALASDVTIDVTTDESGISDKVKALVSAASAAASSIGTYTAQGAVLQGKSDVRTIGMGISSAVSKGTAAGESLKKYGIDMDNTGAISFDADTFASAYAADPTGTQNAIASSFASALDTVSTSAVAAGTGSITQALSSITTTEKSLNDGISAWTTRLSLIQDQYTTKFTAMETALAKLQSQSTYLTSMFNSINGTSSSSSSSSG